MNSIPTIANGGVLVYMAVALLLVFLAAVSRPSHRVVAIDGTHHKNHPDASIRQDCRAGATTTTLQEREVVMTDSTSTRLYCLKVTYPAAALKINRWGEEVLDPEFVPDMFTPTTEIPEFYWPADHRIYRSRSGATERAALLRFYGCTVDILEATPVWETIPQANARRRRDRLEESVDRFLTGKGLSVRIVKEVSA